MSARWQNYKQEPYTDSESESDSETDSSTDDDRQTASKQAKKYQTELVQQFDNLKCGKSFDNKMCQHLHDRPIDRMPTCELPGIGHNYSVNLRRNRIFMVC
jgi:hypothetical protein